MILLRRFSIAVLLAPITLVVLGAPSAGAQASPSSTTPPDATVVKMLETKMVTTGGLPKGYKRQPDSVGDTGPAGFDKMANNIALDKAISISQARALLERDQFTASLQRLWYDKHRSEIIVELSGFGSAATAQDYVATEVRAIRDSISNGKTKVKDVRAVKVGGVPGATGLVARAHGRTGAAFYFARGSVAVAVVSNSKSANGVSDRGVQVAKAQYKRLV